MAVSQPIIGKRAVLRCAEERDAEFTLGIRNDPKLTQFIPKVSGTLENQINWIRNQREKSGDYFFIIENRSGKPVGTISYYDVNEEEKVCELGRYISVGNSLENVEAAVLLLDHIFSAGINTIVLNNDEKNEKIIRFWEKFGAKFNEKVSMNGWTAAQYFLIDEEYNIERNKIVKLLKY